MKTTPNPADLLMDALPLLEKYNQLLEEARAYHKEGKPEPQELHKKLLEAQAAYLAATGTEKPR